MSCRRFGVLRVTVLAAVILMSCVSCTELRLVSHVGADAHQLVGHKIRVTTIDGDVLEFRLLEITEDALVGESQQVQFDNVAVVRQSVSTFWRDACLAMVAVAAGIVILLIRLDARL